MTIRNKKANALDRALFESLLPGEIIVNQVTPDGYGVVLCPSKSNHEWWWVNLNDYYDGDFRRLSPQGATFLVNERKGDPSDVHLSELDPKQASQVLNSS